VTGSAPPHADASRPSLAGRTLVVTRAEGKTSLLLELIEKAGGRAVSLPTIRFVPPEDEGPMLQALDRLGDYDWILFTSSTSVESFFSAARRLGLDDSDWSRIRFGVVGPSTASQLASMGIHAGAVVIGAKAESLAQLLLAPEGGMRAGERCLLPQADIARAELQDRLGAAGVAVDNVIAYRTIAEMPEKARPLLEALRRGDAIDAIIFASPSAFENLLSMLGEEGVRLLRERAIPLISIGPTTSQAIEARGFRVAAQAAPYTTNGLFQAAVDFLAFRDRIRAKEEAGGEAGPEHGAQPAPRPAPVEEGADME
jgi:uroporphyrinogen III methyltransferase/synthase